MEGFRLLESAVRHQSTTEMRVCHVLPYVINDHSSEFRNRRQLPATCLVDILVVAGSAPLLECDHPRCFPYTRLVLHLKETILLAQMCIGVWHSLNKHQVTRDNPAYKELLNEFGRWFFNISVGEQTNAWLQGYRSICCESFQSSKFSLLTK